MRYILCSDEINVLVKNSKKFAGFITAATKFNYQKPNVLQEYAR